MAMTAPQSWRINLPLFLTVTFLTLSTVTCQDQLRNLQARVVGGTVAPPTRYPYFTALQFQNCPDLECGGFLIAPDVVATAASCFDDTTVKVPGQWAVFVNKTKHYDLTGFEYRRVVDSITLHPNHSYDASGIPQYDVALLKLKAQVNGITPLKLNKNAQLPSNNQQLQVIGIGTNNVVTEANALNLQIATVNAISFNTCRDFYLATGDTVRNNLMFCAGAPGRDACYGDGGSPLIIRGASVAADVAVGLVSWGPVTGCAVANSPGVYARISTVQSWMETTTCSLSKASVKPSFCNTGGGGGFVCFSQETYVTVKDRGDIPMKDLQLGDEVLVANNKYEPVYSFGHRSVDVSGQYLKFSPSSLELSADHMVFVEGKGAIPASLVMIGDKFVGGQAVTAIRKVTSKGAYAPFTPSGTIVVNGVQASSFVSFQNSAELMLGPVSTGLKYQWLAHLFELPHRVWCYHLGACSEEQYTVNGISMWVNQPHKMAQWFISLSVFGKISMLIPLVLIGLMLILVQLVLWYPAGFAAIAVLCAGALQPSRVQVKFGRPLVFK